MRAVIIGLVFAAVMLAGGVAYLLNSYLSSQQAELEAQVEKNKKAAIEILVAATDMPVGTPINANNTEWIFWPEDNLIEGAMVRTPKDKTLAKFEKEKHVTRRALSKGEPVTMARLYKAESPGFLRGTLAPGMRAVAVASNAKTAAGGFILPGDRVDVMLTHSMVSRALGGKQTAALDFVVEHTSEVIIENRRVLAVDQKVSEFEGSALVGKTILLELTPKEAEILTTAKSMGKLSLLLRSAEERDIEREGKAFTTDVEVSPILSFIKKGGRTSQTPKAMPMAPASAPKASARKVNVYRGTPSPNGGATEGAMPGEPAAGGTTPQ